MYITPKIKNNKAYYFVERVSTRQKSWLQVSGNTSKRNRCSNDEIPELCVPDVKTIRITICKIRRFRNGNVIIIENSEKSNPLKIDDTLQSLNASVDYISWQRCRSISHQCKSLGKLILCVISKPSTEARSGDWYTQRETNIFFINSA